MSTELIFELVTSIIPTSLCQPEYFYYILKFKYVGMWTYGNRFSDLYFEY